MAGFVVHARLSLLPGGDLWTPLRGRPPTGVQMAEPRLEQAVEDGGAGPLGDATRSPADILTAGACLLSLPHRGNGGSKPLDSGFRRNDDLEKAQPFANRF